MKTKIMNCKLWLFVFICASIHSCSDEFVTKRWEAHPIFGTPTIYVVPDKDAKVCQIVWEDAGNATFTIIHKPDWLKVESMTGRFLNGIAEITCSAIRNPLFTNAKIYLEDITIDVDGVGKGIVIVGYNNR